MFPRSRRRYATPNSSPSRDHDDGADTGKWRLPVVTGQRFLTVLGRALTRRCPYCGSPGIFANYFVLRERCPNCGVRFEREEGYFLGGYAMNLIVAEFLGLGLALLIIFGTVARNWDLLWQEALALTLAVLFPVLFFPYSRGVWMAIDLAFHPPGEVVERQLRGVIQHGDDRHRPG